MSKDYELTFFRWDGDKIIERYDRLIDCRERFQKLQADPNIVQARIRGLGFEIETWARMGVKVERPHYRLTDQGWMPDGLSEEVA